MFISDFAIRRPVITVVAMVALVVFGLVSLTLLQTDEFPDVAVPIVVVAVPYPGASPDNVEREIVDPIEQAVSGISARQESVVERARRLRDDHHRVQLREGPAAGDAGDSRRDQRHPERSAAGDERADPHARQPDGLPDRVGGAVVRFHVGRPAHAARRPGHHAAAPRDRRRGRGHDRRREHARDDGGRASRGAHGGQRQHG